MSKIDRSLTGLPFANQVDAELNGAFSDSINRPVDAAAGTTTAETTIYVAKTARTITSIKLCADGAIVANDTDYLTMTIKKRDGAGGAAATVVAATSQVTGGIVIAQFTKVSLGTLANTEMAAGDILTVTVAKAGAGKALPTHSIVVEF